MEQPKSSFTEREQRKGKGRWGKEEEGKRIGKEIKDMHLFLFFLFSSRGIRRRCGKK
jgi:hypothetical protein